MSIHINKEKLYRIDGDGTTFGALSDLRFLLDFNIIKPEDFKKAKLCYNAHNGLGEEGTPEFYPLKFYNEETNAKIWLSNVSAGYRGTGPQGTVEALKLMGFKVTRKMKKTIFEEKITDEVFVK